LDPAIEDRRVSERVAALERVSSDTNTFWSGTRRRVAVVWLQDHGILERLLMDVERR
jgi:hypothetical protein